MKSEIPYDFVELVQAPPVAALTTLMKDGSPQTTVVWCSYDGTHVLINTMRGFCKERNMRRDPRVTLLCYDPRQPLRALELRCIVVEMTETGAGQHLDELCKLYTGRAPYFGTCVPLELSQVEIPVLSRLLPTHVVTLDARGD